MLIRLMLLLLFLAYAAPSARSQTEADLNSELIQEVLGRGVLLETLVGICRDRAPANDARNRQAYTEWKARNQWEALTSPFATNREFQTTLEQMRQVAIKEMSATKDMEIAASCPQMPLLMKMPQFDPSVRNSAELKRMGDLIRSNQAARTSASSAGAAPNPPMPPPPSGPVTAGDLTFTPPPGWSVGKSSGDKITLEYYADKTSKITLFSKPIQMRGSITETFRQAIQNEFSSVDLRINYIKFGKNAYGSSAAYFDEAYYTERQDSTKMRAAGVAYDLGGRLQIALLTTYEYGKFYDRKRELEEMVRSFRFQSVKSAPVWDVLKPPKGAGGLEGVYMCSRLIVMPNAFGGLNTEVDRNYAIFFSNGQYYEGLPKGGRVLEIDFAEALRTNCKECGLYRLEGNNLIIEKLTDFDIIEERVLPFKRQNANSITFDMPTAMKRHHPFENVRLSGKYNFNYYAGGSTAYTSGSVASSKSIEFMPDGRYRKSGFVGLTFSGTGASGVVSTPQGPETGRYTISGFRLTLTPDNGAPEHFTIMFDDSPPDTTLLYIDDMAFLK